MGVVPLTSLRGEALWHGDIIRLPFDYMYGPGSDGVDLIVHEDRGNFGLSVMPVTGRKAGLVWTTLPPDSCPEGTRSIDVNWLCDNWQTWFAYGHDPDKPLEAIPIEEVVVLRCDTYAIVARGAD